MKTQEQLSKMTEQDLTFELACLVFGEDECYKTRCLQVEEVTSGAARYVDISDWSWLMPLAVEHGISVEKSPMRKEFISRTCNVSMSKSQFRCHVDESPQRAIAICLILKLQEIQE